MATTMTAEYDDEALVKWRTFHVPGLEGFNSPEDKEAYLERVRCGLCHQKLQEGEEYDLRPIQYDHERRSSKFRSAAVIVHRKCIEEA